MANSLIFGNRLMRSNCTITVQETTPTIVGGTPTDNWTNIATGIEVLASLEGGGRDGSYGSDNQRDYGVMSGVSNYLDRTDVRFKITDFPTMPYWTNTYWRVKSSVRHPQGIGGLQCMRIRAAVSRLDMPAENSSVDSDYMLDFSDANNSMYALWPVWLW